ncbi:insulin-like growth factor binding protein [Anaeramoeba flamelloides]|uniref:Insulin-like growth factor binding protein n=1 Tax=Anaeramoeba flamelloides TaxID=1746091 RepID=A0ABQ8Y3Z7_9EUKA|nr:insulin-like growth factor binding protein [Anaeramoeba flamelloides]
MNYKNVLKLKNQNKTTWNSSKEFRGIILGQNKYMSGKHKIKIKIDQFPISISEENAIILGVVNTQNRKNLIKNRDYEGTYYFETFGNYNLLKSLKKKEENGKEYEKRCPNIFNLKQNDIFEILLDMDQKTIEFQINQNNLGGWGNLPKSVHFFAYLAYMGGYRNNQITLMTKFDEKTKTILYVNTKVKNHPNQHKKQILFVGDTLNEVTWYFQESSVFVSHKSGNQFTIDFLVHDSFRIYEKQIGSNCQDFEKTIQRITQQKKERKTKKEEIDKQGTNRCSIYYIWPKINVTLEFTLEEKTQNIKYNLFLPNYRSLKYFHLSYKTKLDLKVNQLNELEFLDSNSKVIFKESAPLFFQKGFVFKGKYFLSQQSPPLKSNTSTSTSTSTNTNTNIKTNTNIDIKTKDTKTKQKPKKTNIRFGFETGNQNIKDFDPLSPIILDPAYSTYIGGGDSDKLYSSQYDSEGMAVSAGESSSVDFLGVSTFLTSGRKNKTEGTNNGLLIKVDPLQGNLVYSTFIGSSYGDTIYSLKLSQNDANVIVGTTLGFKNLSNSYIADNTYPVTENSDLVICSKERNTTQSFLSIISSNGSSLSYSTYICISEKTQVYGVEFVNNYTQLLTCGNIKGNNDYGYNTNDQIFFKRISFLKEGHDDTIIYIDTYDYLTFPKPTSTMMQIINNTIYAVANAMKIVTEKENYEDEIEYNCYSVAKNKNSNDLFIGGSTYGGDLLTTENAYQKSRMNGNDANDDDNDDDGDDDEDEDDDEDDDDDDDEDYNSNLPDFLISGPGDLLMGSTDAVLISINDLCMEGFYQSREGTCVPCPIGTYALSQTASGNQTHLKAPALIAPREPIATKRAQQFAYPAVKGHMEILRNYFHALIVARALIILKNGSSDETDCIKCPKGTYSNALGSVSLVDCKTCPINYISNQTGSSACIQCTKGYESNAQNSQCVTCSEGYLKDSKEQLPKMPNKYI